MSSLGVKGLRLTSSRWPLSLCFHLQTIISMWVSIQHGRECFVNTLLHDIHTGAERDSVITIVSSTVSRDTIVSRH